ncbi:branched-chain amino acid ABC transporter ATP-binding protein [Bradyrhizobium sp. SSBR45G]|uniref:ABC transporter ATP-binding protein n=1 Tax=unclassified Bradyrhizobium TaxID=2631580 RepID=UPI0023429CC2|nr:MULTISPECIES: ATP-binding cassette domain-containing protein [unclassified Bradyrhizobium]GLH80181.1 branched-chain amino acid ABC transporter ATP-binding protein [Bradyrhizobium sp. SSBR45G]GLH87674.1 branched-chain amino acid ABC transporter ATP-binding protein [Bradyrhizobium sp. SSBR45R]
MTTLTVSHLNVMRGKKSVVDDVSLRLETGRITALLGPNGAGKSSLVHALAGLLPAAGGRIESDGASLVGKSPEAIRGAGIAAVLEGHRVLSGLSVDDNLQAAGFNHSRITLKAAIREVYDIFPELAERKGQRAGSMSGGQQQMLSLGQAIVCRPKFIFADEMSLGLAPLIVKRLMSVISRLASQGTGILLIEQFAHVALQLASEVHVMSRGRLNYSGAPQPLIDDPEILHRAYLA